MKKYSAEYYQNNGQYGDRPALGMYFRMFRRYVKSGDRILEFGAGNGFLSRRLATTYRSDAVEISSYARRNIKINSPNTTIIPSENKLGSNIYNGIISLHTLEHINDPLVLVQKLAKSLRRGGVLLVVMPNPDGFGHRLKENEWFAYKDETHVSLLSSDDWKRIVHDNGLNIIKTGSDWFWDPPYLNKIPTWIQKLLFYPGCLLMVILGNIIYPEKWGEDLIIVARKD